MANPLETFTRSARDLSRNPLGIISLFIVLVYAMASLVLGLAGSHLEHCERIPLVWFLVIFPVLVLAVFAWLVSQHHPKLYAPSDYKNEDNFLRSLSPQEQRQKLIDEVATLSLQPEPAPVGNLPESESQSLAEAEIITRHQDIRSAYVLAEDLVLRDLEARFGTSLRRHCVIGSGTENVELDAVVIQEATLIAIEIKYFRRRLPSSDMVEQIATKMQRVARVAEGFAGFRTFSFTLAVVTELPLERKRELESRLRERLSRLEIPYETVLYDFDDLKRRFGVEQA